MTSLWFARLFFEELIADFKANSHLGSSPPNPLPIQSFIIQPFIPCPALLRDLRALGKWSSLRGWYFWSKNLPLIWPNSSLTKEEKEPIKNVLCRESFVKVFAASTQVEYQWWTFVTPPCTKWVLLLAAFSGYTEHDQTHLLLFNGKNPKHRTIKCPVWSVRKRTGTQESLPKYTPHSFTLSLLWCPPTQETWRPNRKVEIKYLSHQEI